MGKILVVEDEAAIAELIALHLRHEGHQPRIAISGPDAQAALLEQLPDLIVLDWMLPGEPGPTLLARWRTDPRTKSLPVIMLTARAQETDKIKGLDAGADDYLTKPFSPAELMARVRALLRRRAPEALDAPLQAGELKLDPAARRVFSGGRELQLGPTEFKLLRYLMSHPERVHTRAQLLDKVWGDHVFIEERTVDVHVKRLRDALRPAGCDELIETVRGSGYRLAAARVNA
ncbi:MAG: phosphate regulon transcriptional regulator PhoB [Burkholderiales bacterium]|nr:phosphate regulon transcriptional regulator PhoB [Burkholderiales bacterium]